MATGADCEIRHGRIDRNLVTYVLIQTHLAPNPAQRAGETHAVEWGAWSELPDVDYQDFRNTGTTAARWRTR